MAKKKYSLDVFTDQLVEVVTTTEITVSSDSDVGFINKTQPMIITGIFLAHDADWVYLGTEEGALSDTLNIHHVVHIGVTKKLDKYDAMLDDANSGSFN